MLSGPVEHRMRVKGRSKRMFNVFLSPKIATLVIVLKCRALANSSYWLHLSLFYGYPCKCAAMCSHHFKISAEFVQKVWSMRRGKSLRVVMDRPNSSPRNLYSGPLLQGIIIGHSICLILWKMKDVFVKQGNEFVMFANVNTTRFFAYIAN